MRTKSGPVELRIPVIQPFPQIALEIWGETTSHRGADATEPVCSRAFSHVLTRVLCRSAKRLQTKSL